MLLLLAFPANIVLGNPVGEKVVAGSATFQRSANALTINQSSDRAIINWQGFSIGVSELTRFIQPSALSATLNRVVSGNPSALLGRLEANGRIFLINPNGILVGGGAVIDTNSFIASTLDVRDSQFLAGGDLNFMGGSSAGVQNLGTIHAEGGDVFLIAHTVDNAGAIEASKGTVGLAAGHDVLLKHAGDERLFVQATVGGGAITETGVNNASLVSAVQAELRGAGGNVYALAVNNAGAIHATGITEKDGRILLTSAGGNIENSGILTARNANGDGGTVTLAGGHDSAAVASVASSGVIDASGKSPGSKGGSVAITGDYVGLTGNALVDVSGDAGGGTVLLGGDYHGSNPAIQNADVTLVSKDARINADAIASGDGGKVIVWADHSTEFDGYISARGGANGGNGGFVETSGKVLQVGLGAQVDAGASNGSPGQWLLDPFNVEIGNFATTNGGFNGGNPNLFTPTGNTSKVNAGTISTALTSGTRVTITTTGAGIIPFQPGDITVNADIQANVTKKLPDNSDNPTPVPTLTLEADNQIIINAAIQACLVCKGLTLTANANDAINVTSLGNLFGIRNGAFTADKRVGSTGGITISGIINSIGDQSVSDRFTLEAAGNITGAGTLQAFNVDLNSTAGSVIYSGSLGANLLTAAAPAGSITINNARVGFLGGISSGGGAINITNSGDNIVVVGAVVAGGGNSLSITTDGTLNIDSKGIRGMGTGSLTAATGTVALIARDVSESSNILNSVAPSITADGLAISAHQGIGSGAGNPLQTSVANLEAQTVVGGVFIKNTGEPLTIGIPSFAVNGVGGVFVTDPDFGDQIQIVNDRTISLSVAGSENAHVAGPNDILVQANGTTSDLVIASNSRNAVKANGGNVTLNAGRDVVIGKDAGSGDVTGSTISLNAGHAVVVDEGSRVTGAAGGINATAGTIVPSTDGRPTSIVFFQTAVPGAHFETSDGGPINLTTAPGGFIDLHSGGNTSSIRTTLTPGNSGPITFKTDDVNLADQIDAGVNPVTFNTANTASPGKPIDLGTDNPTSTPNFPLHVGTTALSLTNAELNNIHASSVSVGDSSSGNATISAPIDISAANVNLLFVNAGGGVQVANSLTANNLFLQAQNDISGSGAITTNLFRAASSLGRIALAGPLTIANADFVSAHGDIDLSSLSNRINILGAVHRGGDLTVRNTLPLTLNGPIDDVNTDTNVTIRTVGDLTLAPGTHIVSSGAHTITLESFNGTPPESFNGTLESFNGHFINNAGDKAVDPQGGARFRIYSVDQNSPPFSAGGLPVTFTASPVVFPNDPLAPNNVFYFQGAAQPAPPVQTQPSSTVQNQTLPSDAQLLAANAAFALELQKFQIAEAQKPLVLQQSYDFLTLKQAALKEFESEMADLQAIEKAQRSTLANQDTETALHRAFYVRYDITLDNNREAEELVNRQKYYYNLLLNKGLALHESKADIDAFWAYWLKTASDYLNVKKTENANLTTTVATITDLNTRIENEKADIAALNQQIKNNQPAPPPVFHPPIVTISNPSFNLEEAQQLNDALTVAQSQLQILQDQLAAASEKKREDEILMHNAYLDRGKTFARMSEAQWRDAMNTLGEFMNLERTAESMIDPAQPDPTIDETIADYNERIAAEQAHIADLQAQIAANNQPQLTPVVSSGPTSPTINIEAH